MMHSPILTSLLFFLLIVHVESRQRRGIVDRLVNDQSLAIRRTSEAVRDQHRRHGEDMRKHDVDRADQKRHHSRIHTKEAIDRTDDRRHELGDRIRKQDRRIHMRDRSGQGRQSGTRTENPENRDARKQLPARMDERIRYQRQQYRRRIDPRRHNVRRVNIRTQNINQGTGQVDQRVATRDRGGNQPVNVSTHRRGTYRTDTVVARSEIGDKSEVEKAIEYRRRIHQNGQRRVSHLGEQRRREYQRILAERRRIQGTRNVDSADTNNPRRILDRRTIDPTGVNVERVDNLTAVSNREGAERVGLDSRKKEDSTGIDIRRRHNQREINTQERVYPIGIDNRRRHDPTGVYTVDHRRANSRLISGVVDPRQPEIREGGAQITDHRRHHRRSNTRGEAVDPRITHLSTDSSTTNGKERVNHRGPQVEVSDDSKINERVDQRTQTGEVADVLRRQGNTRDDLRNEQSNRRIESTRVVTNRRFDPRRVHSNTRTDLRRVSTRTDARRVNIRDPTGIQASLRRWQQNTDSTKSQIDQASAIDIRRHNRRRTIADTKNTEEHMSIGQLHLSRQQRLNESNQRRHPRPHPPQENLATKQENTSKVTVGGLERGHEIHFGKPASIKEQERDTVIQDENKNNANQRTVSGRHTVNSGNVHRRRANSRGSNRVDVRTLTALRAQRDRILREREIERQRLIQEREEQRRRIVQERENRRILKSSRNETLVDPRRRSVSGRVNSDGGTVNQNVESTQSIHNKEVDASDPRLDRRRAHTIENNDPPRRRIDIRRVQHYERTIVPSNTNAYRNTRRIQHSARRGSQSVNGRIADLQDTGRQSHPQSLHGSHNGHPNIALSDGVIIGGPLEIFPASRNATYISESSIISRVYKNGRGRPIERVLVRPDNERTSSVISDTDPTGVGIGNSRGMIRRQDLPPTDTRRSGSTTSDFDPTGIRNSGHSHRREHSTPNDRRRHRFVGTSLVSSTVDSSNAAGEANGRRSGPSRESSGSIRHGSHGNRRPINQFPGQPIVGPKGIITGAVLE